MGWNQKVGLLLAPLGILIVAHLVWSEPPSSPRDAGNPQAGARGESPVRGDGVARARPPVIRLVGGVMQQGEELPPRKLNVSTELPTPRKLKDNKDKEDNGASSDKKDGKKNNKKKDNQKETVITYTFVDGPSFSKKIAPAEPWNDPAIPPHPFFPVDSHGPAHQKRKPALAVTFPDVLRLAILANLDIAIAREVVQQALASQHRVNASFLPTLSFGTTVVDHDGRIQRAEGQVFSTNRNSLFVGGAHLARERPDRWKSRWVWTMAGKWKFRRGSTATNW